MSEFVNTTGSYEKVERNKLEKMFLLAIPYSTIFVLHVPKQKIVSLMDPVSQRPIHFESK